LVLFSERGQERREIQGRDVSALRTLVQLAKQGTQRRGIAPERADARDAFYLEDETGRATLFFSSSRAGNSDIYSSVVRADGSFGDAEPVPGLNTAFEDARPNLRRDGLEIVFDSNRPGTNGGPDIYVSVRPTVDDPWSEPVNLGPDVNTELSETRASLSWDGLSLYFGSNRAGGEGSTDIYLSTRDKAHGPE
jgi:Tol biopolymer transport system component